MVLQLKDIVLGAKYRVDSKNHSRHGQIGTAYELDQKDGCVNLEFDNTNEGVYVWRLVRYNPSEADLLFKELK